MNGWASLIALAFVSVALPVGWHKWVEASSEQAPLGQRFGSAARFFYFAGLPYLAVITGVLPPRFLGLKGLENFISINLAEGWVIAAAGLQKAVSLLLLECLADGSLIIGVSLAALLLLIGLRLGLARLGLGLATGTQATILDSLYDCLHWAFYRGIFWFSSGDLYLGVVWGVVAVVVERALLAWAQKDEPAQKLYLLTNTIILLMTSTIFFYSPNLWLLGLIHVGLAALANFRPSGRRAIGYSTITPPDPLSL